MKKYILLLSSVLFIISSCSDEKVLTLDNQENIQSSRDYLMVEKLINNIYRSIEEGFIYNGESKQYPNYNLLNNNPNNNDTLIIDFGEENSLEFGLLKRGKIISIFNKKYHDSLSVITTSFNQFYMNNILIEGNFQLSCLGENNENNKAYNLEISNTSFTTNEGVININASYQKELISGSNSRYNLNDDKYLLNGIITGNSSNGNEFNVSIIEPILIKLECFQSSHCITTSGVAIITPENYNSRLINYGDSLCDCNMNIELDENNYLIVLD